jgi:hypothetical protein
MIGDYYDALFASARQRGVPVEDAADLAATAYLDGKPVARGKRKWSAAERHAAFWASSFLPVLPVQAWQRESLEPALVRYLGQDHRDRPDIVGHVATRAPEVLLQAVRHSGLVLRPMSPRWLEIAALAESQPAHWAESVQILLIFRQAHDMRVADVERLRQPLKHLTPLDLLVHASLYAFERLIPAALQSPSSEELSEAPDVQEVWDAVEDLLNWKLRTCDAGTLEPGEADIAASLRQHLVPFLFPSHEAPSPRHDLHRAFAALLQAQIELGNFIARSAESFSYDDSVRFVRRGGVLDIVEVDAAARTARHREGDKLARLHAYWLHRGMEALMASPELLARVSPAHFESNLQAFAKAMGTRLRLEDVYGVAGQVTTDAGSTVDVWQALLATELTTAFYIEDFLKPFQRHLQQSGHPWIALGRLAFGGLLQSDMQNRFPITWSQRADKVARITPWCRRTK